MEKHQHCFVFPRWKKVVADLKCNYCNIHQKNGTREASKDNRGLDNQGLTVLLLEFLSPALHRIASEKHIFACCSRYIINDESVQA